MIIILIILIPIIAWMLSMYLLSEWSKRRLFYKVNGILFACYLAILIYEQLYGLQDTKGIDFFFRLTICLATHVLAVFAFALLKDRRK